MRDDTEETKLVDHLTDLLSRLREVFARGLIPRDVLAAQILEIIGSDESRRLWEIRMKPDAMARRLLARLEDPVRWRTESALPADQRLVLLKERLSGQLLGSVPVDAALLDLLLDTADLPHFASFIPSTSRDPAVERAGVELSVLD